MADRSKKDDVKKKPYARPEVKKVRLKPEEAVLGGCKTLSYSGPATTCTGTPSCPTNAS